MALRSPKPGQRDLEPHEARRRGRVLAGDLGLFGPASVAWRIHRHPALLLGGLRALMVQALHPLAMAAVADFSDYRADVWGRYDRTTTYVVTTIYGTTRQAHAAGARVRAVHAPMRGFDRVTGQRYRADDPVLLLWVHAILVESFVAAYERYVGTLPPDDRDRYVAEMVRQAELVGLRAEDVPASWRALQDFLRWIRPQLRVSAAARDAFDVVLHPPLTWWKRPFWALVAEGGVALLPEYAMQLYGLRRHPVRAALLRPPVHVGSAFVRRFVRPRLVIRDALARARAWEEDQRRPSRSGLGGASGS